MHLNSGIYCIRNTINNKKYIGSCFDFNKRKNEHFQDFSAGINSKLMQKDYDLFGKENFIFEIIEKLTPDTKLLIERENFWMDSLETYVPKYGKEYGYNLKRASMLDEKSRQKISESVMGKNNPNYGNKLSKEKRELISKKVSGLKNPNVKLNLEQYKEIIQLLKEETKESVKEKCIRIANIYNISPSTVGNIRDGKHWCYKELDK